MDLGEEVAATSGWRSSASIVALPLAWQRPAKTEEWAYEGCVRAGLHATFSQLLCFPWATLIDLLDRGCFESAKPLLDGLDAAPVRTTLVRATVCQHVRLVCALPYLLSLGITDVFWSHAKVGELQMDGIRVHPFPLYPVRCFENPRLVEANETVVKRPLLYSFVGAYCADGYLTQVRQWIFDLPESDVARLSRRSEWHYESHVYGEQVGRRPIAPEQRTRLAIDAAEYDRTLRDSIFSLCPSGTGPNSIRLWESLGFGCIPVLLADTLRLPGPAQEWEEAIIRVPETREAVVALPERLEKIGCDRERIDRMRRAGRRLWLRYVAEGPKTVLSVLADNKWVRDRVIAKRAGVGPRTLQ